MVVDGKPEGYLFVKKGVRKIIRRSVGIELSSRNGKGKEGQQDLLFTWSESQPQSQPIWLLLGRPSCSCSPAQRRFLMRSIVCDLDGTDSNLYELSRQLPITSCIIPPHLCQLNESSSVHTQLLYQICCITAGQFYFQTGVVTRTQVTPYPQPPHFCFPRLRVCKDGLRSWLPP